VCKADQSGRARLPNYECVLATSVTHPDPPFAGPISPPSGGPALSLPPACNRNVGIFTSRHDGWWHVVAPTAPTSPASHRLRVCTDLGYVGQVGARFGVGPRSTENHLRRCEPDRTLGSLALPTITPPLSVINPILTSNSLSLPVSDNQEILSEICPEKFALY
jgi:hypothetical protein